MLLLVIMPLLLCMLVLLLAPTVGAAVVTGVIDVVLMSGLPL
jgi:hypothetical protein